MIETMYWWLSLVSLLVWVALPTYCLPGLLRMVVGRAQYFDPLKAMFVLLSLSRIGYGGRRLIKGEVPADTLLEAYLLMALLALGIIGGVFAIFALHSYTKTAREFAKRAGELRHGDS